MAVIEYARNVLGLKDANSEEANPETDNPVIHVMPNQKEYLKSKQYGGTIRLGAWPCRLAEGSLIKAAYEKFAPERIKNDIVEERHRHRYEFNNDYREKLEKAGLVTSGTSPDGQLCEAVELPSKIHPFFVGTQFHPEYKSRPLAPHPIFTAFVEACLSKAPVKARKYVAVKSRG
jgi:CTP synthase